MGSNLIFLGACGFTAFLVLSLLVAPTLLKPSPGARRMMELVQSSRPDHRKVSGKEQFQGWILSLATGVRVRFGLAEDDKVKQQMFSAGIKTGRGINLYFAVRVLLPVLGGIGGSLLPNNTLFYAMSIAAVLYLVPDMWLKIRIKKRRERIRKSLPDALDLLVICVEAGLGLDQAMLRVGQELNLSHPDIHTEFMQVNLEQMAGKPRLAAWNSAAERTEIPEFQLFVSMLTQADRFGTPIVRALSRFGDEIRQKRRQRAEEAAAKTKIKILFPLVLFIFPCIFIVLLAPAVLNIARNIGISH